MLGGAGAEREPHGPQRVRVVVGAGTVGELAQAWQSDPLFPLAASDPVVSSAGVHVVVGGCAAFSFDPSDGEWLMLDRGVSPLCETGGTAFMQSIHGYSPPGDVAVVAPDLVAAPGASTWSTMPVTTSPGPRSSVTGRSSAMSHGAAGGGRDARGFRETRSPGRRPGRTVVAWQRRA